MRILVIAQHFPPEAISAAFRIGDTVRVLSEMNHEVLVITGKPIKGLPANHHQSFREAGKAKVMRSPILFKSPSGKMQYVIHYLSFALGAIVNCLLGFGRRWRPDVIWCSSPPLTVSLPGIVASKLWGAPLVGDIRDIWPETAVAAGQFSEGSSAFRLAKKLELKFYASCKGLTTVAKPMREELIRRSNLPIEVVYNGAAEEDESVESGHSEKRSSNDKNTIVYAGNLGRLQSLDVMLDVFLDLKKRGYGKGWELLLIGSGALEVPLRKVVSDHGHGSSVIFAGQLSKKEAVARMSKAQLLYFGLMSSEVLRFTIPSKLFDYLAIGVPILASIEGEGADILRQVDCNKVVKPGDIESIKEGLMEAMDAIEKGNVSADANRDLVKSTFGRKRSVEKLELFLKEIVEQGRCPRP